ncbi:glyoxylate reductase/hydroxypyruvate reductase-like [Pyrus ussuriensis x Pyrus communis]|uniref:Glyoxylate reductase/hydroxypyruvate reductase-like n=1 Tax=Pyrus ussuriensis x Pyrus communis TaxID=2448454 RepID=A0A5N5G295_9ROSA|nr:glyoxylate reductase/hydroxypyruvate reductase-like [Pyrus ussuriensis x Pyrus communis]
MKNTKRGLNVVAICHLLLQFYFTKMLTQPLISLCKVPPPINMKLILNSCLIVSVAHLVLYHSYLCHILTQGPPHFGPVDDVPLKDVPGVIQNYNICIVKIMKLDSDLLSRAEKMKLVMQYGVGLEAVDIDSATKFGIKVARIPSHLTGNAASCAKTAIYLMLGLLREQNEMQISVKLRKAGDPIGETLIGKTVFILGYGNIGIELAKRLRPFGVKIIASKRRWNLVDEKCVHEDIHKFASKADIVVGIVNKSFISSMRKPFLTYLDPIGCHQTLHQYTHVTLLRFLIDKKLLTFHLEK